MPLHDKVVLVISEGAGSLAERLRDLNLPAEIIADIDNFVRPITQPGEWAVDPWPQPVDSSENPTVGPAPPTYNRIPGAATGPCTPMLVVFCSDDDDLDQRLREALDHVRVTCKQTRRVVLVTSQSNDKIWQQHADGLHGLRAEVQPIIVMRGRIRVR